MGSRVITRCYEPERDSTLEEPIRSCAACEARDGCSTFHRHDERLLGLAGLASAGLDLPTADVVLGDLEERDRGGMS